MTGTKTGQPGAKALLSTSISGASGFSSPLFSVNQLHSCASLFRPTSLLIHSFCFSIILVGTLGFSGPTSTPSSSWIFTSAYLHQWSKWSLCLLVQVHKRENLLCCWLASVWFGVAISRLDQSVTSGVQGWCSEQSKRHAGWLHAQRGQGR